MHKLEIGTHLTEVVEIWSACFLIGVEASVVVGAMLLAGTTTLGFAASGKPIVIAIALIAGIFCAALVRRRALDQLKEQREFDRAMNNSVELTRKPKPGPGAPTDRQEPQKAPLIIDRTMRLHFNAEQ